jgi:large subunit ribosomal protein L23
MNQIIKKPIITEKANMEAEDYNRFSFIVDRSANKVEIKKEIERMYGISVEKVATLNYDGKNKQRYTKSGLISGRKNNYKKAVVTVAEGETIDLYAGL